MTLLQRVSGGLHRRRRGGRQFAVVLENAHRRDGQLHRRNIVVRTDAPLRPAAIRTSTAPRLYSNRLADFHSHLIQYRRRPGLRGVGVSEFRRANRKRR